MTTLVMENRKFTNTAIPVFSGAEGWYQHIHIVQAIVKSNGWPEETAALQLFVHLKGEALNVALLLTKKERESWTGLVKGLAAYYQSPGRLAGLRRRFESAFRQPGLEPATFATDLGMLAIQGFGDMREQARDTMTRDKFIAGQEQYVRATKAIRWVCTGYPDRGNRGQLPCVGESLRLELDC